MIKKDDFYLLCDAPGCGHNEPKPRPETLEQMRAYIGTPCPKCGANLLTKEDAAEGWPIFEKLLKLEKSTREVCAKLDLDFDELERQAEADPNAKRVVLRHHDGVTRLEISDKNRA